MPGLKLFSSNQLEFLAEQLSKTLSVPLSSALAKEVILVQSRGMGRWITFQIAQRSGICMNCEFPFPQVFLERTLRGIFPEMAAREEFSIETMLWRVLALLPEFAERQEFVQVNSYLSADDGMKAFQLAAKIARLFDQYLVYRPEMLMKWEREPEPSHWQAILWRALVARSQGQHFAAVLEGLEQKASPDFGQALPERISIFGISSLPPAYLRVFYEFSKHCQVQLFSLHPSQEYYGLDLAPRQRARALQKLAAKGLAASEEALPVGNPLLASMGRLNRDQIETQIELDERAGFVVSGEIEAFKEPAGGSLLQTVQGDILNARNRGTGELPASPHVEGDRSIELHACHSPMREVEVLYDQLLDLFAKDPTLQPREILVMTPDIETYAPFIKAVFDNPEDPKHRIPFSIADRSARSHSPVVETFLALLALPGSRCTASEIYSLLERAPIRQRYELEDGELEIIRRWISQCGIRWGIDGDHRTQFEVPALDSNTWLAGIKRLLLGFAMTGDNRTTFAGIMPHDEVEGAMTEALGRFISAIEALFRLNEQLPAARPLEAWPDALHAMLNEFFAGQEQTADLLLVRQAIEELRRAAQLAHQPQPIAFRVIRHHLAQKLDVGDQRGGYLTGGLTFCALQPMRSIPVRVICLLGMDDLAFPRQSQPLEFDLMAQAPLPGDRSLRDDDRYLFLEVLISARDHLHLSYVGRTSSDNEEIPPSILISELLDYLNQAFVFSNGQSARKNLLVEHRLHALSPEYFRGQRLFSYSQANAAASRDYGSQLPIPKFFSAPLPEPDPSARLVSLHNLLSFFDHPAQYFLRRRLGIYLGENDDTLQDTEPFSLNGLEQYGLKEQMLEEKLEHVASSAEGLSARGLLPLGEMGLAEFQRLQQEIHAFHQRLQPELLGARLGEPLLVDLKLGEFSLSGSIHGIYAGRILQFRCADIKPKDRLRAWIYHLAKCAAFPGQPTETTLVGSKSIVHFTPVADAAPLLLDLLGIYWRGLCLPLPFFPMSSFTYAQKTLFPAGKYSPLEQAKHIWVGNPQKKWGKGGEKDDPCYELCFTDDPIRDDFPKLAMAVFGPLLKHVK